MSKVTTKKFEFIKQLKEIGLKNVQIQQIVKLSSATVSSVIRFNNLQEYKNYINTKKSKSVEKTRTIFTEITARGRAGNGQINGVNIFFDRQGRVVFTNVGWTGDITDENTQLINQLVNEMERQILEANEKFRKIEESGIAGGELDSFAIFNKPLSKKEIRALQENK